MTRPNRLSVVAAATFALATFTSGPCRAGDVDTLVRMIEIADSEGGTLQFLRALQDVGDVNFSRAEIASALRKTGLKGPLKTLLGATKRLRIKGQRVRIDMKNTVSPRLEGAAMRLSPLVTFRLRKGARTTVLDRVRGIEVGESKRALYGLQRVEFTTAGGQPVAKVTAGVAFFTRTKTLPLAVSGEGVVTEVPPLPTPAPRRGLVGALGAMD